MRPRIYCLAVALALIALSVACREPPQTIVPTLTPGEPPPVPSAPPAPSRVNEAADWVWTARVVVPPWDEDAETWMDAVDRAAAMNTSVVLTWIDASDAYPARLEPERGLAELRDRVEYVHSNHPDMRVIVYVGGLEMQTPDADLNGDGVADTERGTAWTDHPDWVQVGIDGEPAVFYGSEPGMPFWVGPTDEDVWLSPAAPGFLELMTDLAGGMAATGVDGVWMDVPFLQFSFGERWVDQWASSDQYSRAAFEEETGLPFPEAVDWNDPAFLRFVAWRYEQTTRYIAAFDQAIKQVNPEAQLIIETSALGGVSRTQTANDLWAIAAVSDATAHELGLPSDWQISRGLNAYQWLAFLANLVYVRGVDLGKPSWSLTYVEAGQLSTARDHAATLLTAGVNYYTSGGEGMDSLVDEGFQAGLFAWLAAHDEVYYSPDLEPLCNVALLDSRRSQDYLDRASWDDEASGPAFSGMLRMLLQAHIPFCLINDSDLTSGLDGYQAVVLPHVGALGDEEADALRGYVRDGGVLMATGETSLYDEWGRRRRDFALADVFGVSYDPEAWGNVSVTQVGEGRAVFMPGSPGLEYDGAARVWVNRPDAESAGAARTSFAELWEAAGVEPILTTDAGQWVVILPYSTPEGYVLRLLNLTDLSRRNPDQTPQTISVTLRIQAGESVRQVEVMSMLGEWVGADFEQGESTVTVSLTIDDHAVVRIWRIWP